MHALEVDQGGTIRGIRTIGSQNILKDLFQTELVRYERKQWPAVSAEAIASVDIWLRRGEYEKKLQQSRAHTKDEVAQGAIAADALSSVERAWLMYRDAWVKLAHLRYPAHVAAIRTEITLERYRLLKTIW
jgi:hypothetical protein